MIAVETRQFGSIEVEEQEIVLFPEGLPGFDGSKRYALLNKGDLVSPFFWLQSMDEPDVALVVVDPFVIIDGYAVDVEDEDIVELEVKDPEQIMTLCVMVIPEDIQQMRVNLRAPILINMENNKGKQIMQKNDDLPIRYFLLQ